MNDRPSAKPGDVPASFETVDAYIASFPESVQPALQTVRQAIRRAAPEATESISYHIAAYKLHGKPVTYFGGWKHHIGLYPLPAGDDDFQAELATYKPTKGTVKLMLANPIPTDFITRLVTFRLAELAAPE
jgi:uncharacterized protein YdhG (YjbR/CyaY superfamily)